MISNILEITLFKINIYLRYKRETVSLKKLKQPRMTLMLNQIYENKTFYRLNLEY